MTIATVPTKAGEDATVTVTLTGTAAAAGTMKIMNDTEVLATVKVTAGAEKATASFTMPQANVELTLAFVAD